MYRTPPPTRQWRIATGTTTITTPSRNTAAGCQSNEERKDREDRKGSSGSPRFAACALLVACIPNGPCTKLGKAAQTTMTAVKTIAFSRVSVSAPIARPSHNQPDDDERRTR